MKDGSLTINETISRLAGFPFQDLGFAKIDHHRSLRTGFPEVIFGQGKSPEQISELSEAVLSKSDRLLVTRTDEESFELILGHSADAVYHKAARAVVVDRRENPQLLSGIVIATGGTSDLPIAEEAVITAELMGCRTEKAFDVGVAGLHRLVSNLKTMQNAKVIVAIAGMEGALASVVGGLVSAPVIAVPTSIGYGSSFEGIAALLSMLNSCAPGVAVVNIDNGFGAGYLAAQIVLLSKNTP